MISMTMALLVAALPQDPPKVEIAWKFKKGDQFRYELIHSQNGAMSGKSYTTEMLLELDLEVADVGKDGIAGIKATFNRIKMKGTHGSEVEVNIDSSRDEIPTGKPDKIYLAFLRSKTFTLKAGPKGISSAEGLLDAMREAFASAKELEEKIPRKAEASAKGFTQFLKVCFPEAPNLPVVVDGGWFAPLSFYHMSLKGATIKDLAKLKSIDRDLATIEHQITIELESGRSSWVQEAKAQGRTIWNLERGIPESHEITTKVRGKISSKEGDVERLDEQTFTLKLSPREKK